MLKISATVLAVTLASCVAVQAGSIDVGVIDQKKPPSAAELKEPGADAKVPVVGVNETVTGKFTGDEKVYVYVIVNPLSNPDTWNVWWVQRGVRRDADGFQAGCQFGEGSQGQGEFFAILAFATDRRYEVGEQLQGLPDGLQCSKLKIVKRAN
jgi:hypothetical protein